MNKALATKVLEQIELHPEEWDQDQWRCETGMCFAGWATQLSGYQWVPDKTVYNEWAEKNVTIVSPYVILPEGDPLREAKYVYKNPDANYAPTLHTQDVAKELLGISAAAADDLFQGTNSLENIVEILQDIENGVYEDEES